MQLLKLSQLYWTKESATPTLLPVVINPEYIIFATEDEMTREGALIIGEKNIERCTAVMMENVDKPIFVEESVDKIIEMIR